MPVPRHCDWQCDGQAFSSQWRFRRWNHDFFTRRGRGNWLPPGWRISQIADVIMQFTCLMPPLWTKGASIVLMINRARWFLAPFHNFFDDNVYSAFYIVVCYAFPISLIRCASRHIILKIARNIKRAWSKLFINAHRQFLPARVLDGVNSESPAFLDRQPLQNYCRDTKSTPLLFFDDIGLRQFFFL